MLIWKPGDVVLPFHSIKDHNFWVDHGFDCPFCLIGSEPVPECLIEGGGG